MSHDSQAPEKVPVNRAEYEKFCYLLRVVDALDRADARVEEDIQHFRNADGTKSDRQFDWSVVVRHCAPQLLISFLRGAERYEDERTFRMFPWAVIVARTASVVYLDAAFELALEDSDADNSVKSAGDALRCLQSYSSQLEGTATANAAQLLRQLSRVLKIKL